MPHIKVLQIAEDLKVGGLERVVESIVLNLDKEKYDVSVLCLCAGGDIYESIKKAGITVSISDFSKNKNPLGMMSLVSEIKKISPDIVHCHGVSANGIGRTAAIMAGVKKIFAHAHTTVTDDRPHVIAKEKMLIAKTEKIFCCSQAVKNNYERIYGTPAEKAVLLYNGVNREKFCQVDLCGLTKDSYLIGCIASLTEHKGHKYLLSAIKLMKEKTNKPFKLVLVGDGSLREKLEAQSVELGITENVFFMGINDQVFRLVNWFDCVVLASSEREGLGICLLEGMSAGKPVIGTNLGGIPEIIEPNKNGLIVPVKDSVALADAMKFYMENEKIAAEHGKAGAELIKEKFELRKIIKTLESFYEK